MKKSTPQLIFMIFLSLLFAFLLNDCFSRILLILANHNNWDLKYFWFATMFMIISYLVFNSLIKVFSNTYDSYKENEYLGE